MGNNFGISLKRQNRGHGPVQRITVMANNQNCAIIVGNDFLQ